MVDLTADCSQCAALCCVALAFDKGEMFAFDKPAGVACKHLKGPLCGIHATLETEGLKGCVNYQCDGAGQRVVQEVFDGQSWQDSPELLPPMLEAFAQMRQVHRHLVLLRAVESLPLSEAQKTSILQFRERLSPLSGFNQNSLAALETSGIYKTISAFYKSLRDIVQATQEGA